MRKPTGISTINPMISNIFIDSCAFDPKYHPEEQSSLKLFGLYREGKINLIIAHSNQKEIDHPKTPSWAKAEANAMIFSIKTSLTTEELQRKTRIHQLLTGNGKPENYEKDSAHIFEASKYGSYFVTTDERILKRRNELARVCILSIIMPSQLIETIEEYMSAYRDRDAHH